MMEFWTIQLKETLKAIDNEGFYQPDFQKVKTYGLNKNRYPRYMFLLESFNRVNNVQFPGLIFGFCRISSNGQYIENVNDFKERIVLSNVINMMQDDKLYDEHHILLRIKSNRLFNPILVDFYDYCDSLEPPYFILDDEDVKMVLQSIERGIPIPSITQQKTLCKKSFYQSHFPNLYRDEIIERHNLPL